MMRHDLYLIYIVRNPSEAVRNKSGLCFSTVNMAQHYISYRKVLEHYSTDIEALRHVAPCCAKLRHDCAKLRHPDWTPCDLQPTGRTHSETVRTHSELCARTITQNWWGKPRKEGNEVIWWFWALLWPAKRIGCTNSGDYLVCKHSEILQIFWLVAQVANNLGRKKWIFGDMEKDMHRPKEKEKDLLERSRFDSGKIYCLRGRFSGLCKCRNPLDGPHNQRFVSKTDLRNKEMNIWRSWRKIWKPTIKGEVLQASKASRTDLQDIQEAIRRRKEDSSLLFVSLFYFFYYVWVVVLFLGSRRDCCNDLMFFAMPCFCITFDSFILHDIFAWFNRCLCLVNSWIGLGTPI